MSANYDQYVIHWIIIKLPGPKNLSQKNNLIWIPQAGATRGLYEKRNW